MSTEGGERALNCWKTVRAFLDAHHAGEDPNAALDDLYEMATGWDGIGTVGTEGKPFREWKFDEGEMGGT
jgi:hypothetical protein